MMWMWMACSSNPCGEAYDAAAAAAVASDADRRPTLIARALVDHCELPTYVEAALRERVTAPPAAAASIGARLATDRPDVWSAACPRGGSRAIVALGRTQNKGALFDSCDVQRLGVVAREEMAAVELPIFTIITAHYLRTAGLPSRETRTATRLLAGLAP